LTNFLTKFKIPPNFKNKFAVMSYIQMKLEKFLHL